MASVIESFDYIGIYTIYRHWAIYKYTQTQTVHKRYSYMFRFTLIQFLYFHEINFMNFMNYYRAIL